MASQKVGNGRPVGVEDLSDPLFFVDRRGRVTYWNPACEAAFGPRAEEVLERQLPGPLGSRFDEGLLALLRSSPREAKPAFLRGVTIGDGSWDVRVSPTVSGSALGVYCVPFGDQFAGWPRVLADSADAIYAMDDRDRIIAWNRAASEMFGYEPQEVLGKSLERLVPADLLAAREPHRLRTALLELGAVRDYETRRVTKDGHELKVSVTRTLLRDRSGKVLGSSSIVRDLSQRQEMERQIIESEKLATLGHLAASVAQEVGAPLTTIRLAVENARRVCEACGSSEQLQIVLEQVDRIGRLTRRLVELAKPGTPKLSSVDVGDVVEQTLELLEPSLRRSGITASVEVEPSLPATRADAGQLQQVLLNLLINAQRAMESGVGRRVQVTARARRGLPVEGRPVRTVVEVTVGDDGPGIDPADLPFIFAPFFSRSGGSGLGLSLAQQIVQAHGGTIYALSTPGHGATFTLQLPVNSDD